MEQSLIHALEELYTFSPLINRLAAVTSVSLRPASPELSRSISRQPQKKLHDGLLDVVARILAFCHGQQNVKFMMTTIRRQAASCLYGLAPLLKDTLTGKLNRLELMEASDDDEDAGSQLC